MQYKFENNKLLVSVHSNEWIEVPYDFSYTIDYLEETFKNSNLIIKNNYTVYTNELTTEMVKEDIGIAWGLKKCIEQELKEGILYEINVPFETPKTKFSIAYNPFFLNKTTIKFIDFLKQNI